MIEFYAWGTTNGRRALVMLEESGLDFTLRQIDLQKGDQKTPEYARINPYRKIPAIIDSEGPGGKPVTLFESVAICIYLAEKTGRFLGAAADRPNVWKWSMFHATNVLPTFASLGRIDHPSFEANAKRQLAVMDGHLAGRDWFADEFSIADIIPFTRVNSPNDDAVKLSDYPNVAAWRDRILQRPAVAKAMAQKFG
jgi:GST-like protein